jgi:hypothetical protein
MTENTMIQERFWPKCQRCGRPTDQGRLCHYCENEWTDAQDVKEEMRNYLRKSPVTKSINRHIRRRTP